MQGNGVPAFGANSEWQQCTNDHPIIDHQHQTSQMVTSSQVCLQPHLIAESGHCFLGNAPVRLARPRSTTLRVAPYPQVAALCAASDVRISSSGPGQSVGNDCRSNFPSTNTAFDLMPPFYHLTSHFSHDELCRVVLLQRKPPQHNNSTSGSGTAPLVLRHQPGGQTSVVSPAGRSTISFGSVSAVELDVKRLKFLSSRGRGGGGGVGSRLWSQAAAEESNLNHQPRARKRKRTAARLDRRQVMRCIHCERVERGGSKFGDYLLCSSCGSSDFAVVADLSPDIRANLETSSDEYGH